MKNHDEVLQRGVEQILPDKRGLEQLMKKRKITLYQGFDPTANSLHIGHFIGLRKLSQFQKLGHKVIFLVGDFTAMIGDPTDKKSVRTKLTRKQVVSNLKDFQKQASRVLQFDGENAAEIKFNSEWLSKLRMEDIIELASNFTVQQFVERDMFQVRIKEEKPIYLHEFLYPLMVGYDSVVMGVDLEIGGNDQLFNMLAGRTLAKTLKNKNKFVMTLKLLTDEKGQKMGKTEGNAIFLSDSANSIYGKIMAWSDNFLDSAIELLTDLKRSELKLSPIELKKKLAHSVVAQVHGIKEANKAQEHFEKTYQKREPEYNTKIQLADNFAGTIAPYTSNASISEAKRLITQGGVDINGHTITDPTHKLKRGDRIKIGKTTFGKIV